MAVSPPRGGAGALPCGHPKRKRRARWNGASHCTAVRAFDLRATASKAKVAERKRGQSCRLCRPHERSEVCHDPLCPFLLFAYFFIILQQTALNPVIDCCFRLKFSCYFPMKFFHFFQFDG